MMASFTSLLQLICFTLLLTLQYYNLSHSTPTALLNTTSQDQPGCVSMCSECENPCQPPPIPPSPPPPELLCPPPPPSPPPPVPECPPPPVNPCHECPLPVPPPPPACDKCMPAPEGPGSPDRRLPPGVAGGEVYGPPDNYFPDYNKNPPPYVAASRSVQFRRVLWFLSVPFLYFSIVVLYFNG